MGPEEKGGKKGGLVEQWRRSKKEGRKIFGSS